MLPVILAVALAGVGGSPITPADLASDLSLAALEPPHVHVAPAPTPPPAKPKVQPKPKGGAEGWRSLVETYFPAGQVELALVVIGCESGGDPGATNRSSGAAGLFQHMPSYWPERSKAAGFGGADIYDPDANVGVAAWLVRVDGWGHWNASRGCWGG